MPIASPTPVEPKPSVTRPSPEVPSQTTEVKPKRTPVKTPPSDVKEVENPPVYLNSRPNRYESVHTSSVEKTTTPKTRESATKKEEIENDVNKSIGIGCKCFLLFPACIQ